MPSNQNAIVCVDDDAIILQILNFQLTKILDGKRFLVECIINPEIALEVIDSMFNDGINLIFVIVDYQMPKMNGAQLIRLIKQKYPDLPCIMLTGEANALQIQELKEENLLSEYLSKPWSESDLKNIIELQSKNILN